MQAIKIKDVISELERLAPLHFQENYDNAGLIIGSSEEEVNGVLLCLDSTEEVVDEALRKGCNLIIAHHPIIFSGLKKINGKNFVERAVIKAIKNNISIYAAHTNLDNVIDGVNKKIADKIGLKDIEILRPKKDQLLKLVTFCPENYADKIRSSLFMAGAGNIGKYDSCSFNLEGVGTFRGNESAKPFLGVKGELSQERETRLEVVFPDYLKKEIIQSLINTHPYEEIAYDIYKLENSWSNVGSGIKGKLDKPVPAKEFMDYLKKIMNLKIIRHTIFLNQSISNVAICGGAGSSLIKDAINSYSDIYITSDLKYHEFFEAERRIILADIGHYESEQFTLELFYEAIQEKFNTFAIRFSETQTNPVNYF